MDLLEAMGPAKAGSRNELSGGELTLFLGEQLELPREMGTRDCQGQAQ